MDQRYKRTKNKTMEYLRKYNEFVTMWIWRNASKLWF